MKPITIIICALFFAGSLLSCSKDQDATITATPSVIQDLDITSYTLPSGDQNPYLFRMTWTKTKYFTNAGTAFLPDSVNYTIQADWTENNFSAPATVGTTSGLYLDIYAETVRKTFRELSGSTEAKAISFRIKGTANNLSAYSEPVSMTITP